MASSEQDFDAMVRIIRRWLPQVIARDPSQVESRWFRDLETAVHRA